jgi:outer membrane protein insertion porin family
VLEGRSRTTSIGLTQVISRDSRDRPEFPTMGSAFTWSSSLTGGPFGGTEHFQEYLQPGLLYADHLEMVLYNHVEFGVIKRLKSGSLVPR